MNLPTQFVKLNQTKHRLRVQECVSLKSAHVDIVAYSKKGFPCFDNAGT